MAAEDAASGAVEQGAQGAKNSFGFLAKKVGPLPLGVWLVAAVVIWYYFAHKNSATSTAGAAGSQTDPAGNVGTIDPATGYVYGTSEDSAALGQNSSDDTSTTDTSGTGTTAGTYPDNNSWARAAINYLVGIGVDPTQANQAVENYITSQTLTTQEQGDVNLAIQGLGAPPDLPGPASTNPGQVVTPPGGTGTSTSTAAPPSPTDVTRYPAPTGLTVTSKTSTSVGLKWADTPGTVGSTKVYPASYTIALYQLNGKTASMTTLSAPDNKGGQCVTTVTGLHPGWSYKISVWANGGKQAPPGASATVALPSK